ncbi:MAG: hypothetical protein C4524_03020 [Candidatus Zixiibacteriota bacterium]|nr:MAG: hypothetical protein C4524_03020 [candidate division Zixibacteria bacterium]
MKRFALALFVVAVVAMVANAGGPWTTPYPWGTDANDWEWTDPASGWGWHEMIYNPTTGHFTYTTTGETVVWPDLNVELFMEWSLELQYEITHFQIHRVNNYDPITISLPAHIKANDPARFQINPRPGYSLSTLDFKSSAVPGYNGVDCPISNWQIAVDGGAPVNMNNTGSSKYYDFPLCDHDFTVLITIDPLYHQNSGRYQLMAELCPIPPVVTP